MLRIGQLAREAGVSDKTLRFYEHVGLIRPAKRTPSGYRLYEPDEIERLKLIRNAQDLGFALADVRTILDAGDAGNDPCVHTLALVDRQLDRLKDRAKRLRDLRRGLLALRARVTEGLGKTSPGGGLCACLTDPLTQQRDPDRLGAKRRHARKEDDDGLLVP